MPEPLEKPMAIYPTLRYLDAYAAISWLSKAFGFEEELVVPNGDGGVAHARLRLGDGAIMLSSTCDDATGLESPQTLGATTVALHVQVADVDAHYERAVAAGARIVGELRDTGHGSRDYGAFDLEGHLWAFSTYRP
jgi:uncharacterized glyoxalase superfamily protein PhnB